MSRAILVACGLAALIRGIFAVTTGYHFDEEWHFFTCRLDDWQVQIWVGRNPRRAP